MTDNDRGLVILNTGNGKGKTTAAIGTAFRALGYGWNVCMIQFIKGEGDWGERISYKKFDNFEWHICGEGFTWNSKDLEKDKATAKRGFDLAKEKIMSEKYDLVILDEITYLPNYFFLDVDDIVELIENRPKNVNIIMTGRDAKEELIEISDTVTDMAPVKHAFEKGILAKKGLEF